MGHRPLFLVIWLVLLATACPSTDADSCADMDCPDNATCVVADAEASCVCDDGYELSSEVCRDIDECAQGVSPCSADATCVNVDGSFVCTCDEGLLGDGLECRVPSVAPPEGRVGTRVVIEGPGLGTERGRITFDGVAAPLQVWTDGQVTISVPDVPPGPVSVRITTSEGASATVPFRVVMPPVLYALAGGTHADVGEIYLFDLDPATGSLEVRPDPVPLSANAPGWVGSCSGQLVIHRKTRRLFATSGDRLDAFDISPSSGNLSPVPGGAIDVPGLAYGVSVNTEGTRIVVTSYATSLVTIVDVAADGRLIPVASGPMAVIREATHSVFSANGDHLYVNGVADLQLDGFSVDSDGLLTPLPDSPLDDAGGSAWTIQQRPGFPQLFVTERTGFDLVYIDETTGAMTAYDANPVTLSDVNQSFAFGPDGDRLYSLGADGQLRIFDLDDEGLPTLVEGSPFSVSANDLSRACAGVTSDGRFLFTASENPPAVEVIDLGEREVAAPPSGSSQGFPIENASPNSVVTAY